LRAEAVVVESFASSFISARRLEMSLEGMAQCWTTHSLDKVFPESAKPPNASTQISLSAARNETEDAQVAIRVPTGVEIAGASFSASDLTGPANSTIPAGNITACWQWFIYVTHNPPRNTDPASYLRKAPAFFPDAFLEQQEIRIRDEWTQPLWVSVSVPEDAKPGGYSGTLRLDLTDKGGEKCRLDVPISLTVWPFELPDESHLHHTEWLSVEAFCEYYGLQPWSEQLWKWIERAAEDMARHKQDMILTRFPSLVRVIRRQDGSFAFDFAKLDRWIETFRKAGVRWIEGGHVARRVGGWESEIAWSRFPVYNESGIPLDTSREAMGDEEFAGVVEALLKSTYAHLRQRGWQEQYVQHVSDEPVAANRESWRRISARLHEWLPDVRRIDAVMSGELSGDIEMSVRQIQEVTGPSDCRYPEELWSYVCLAPQGIYPNRFLDYASIRNRIIFWLSWSLGLKGFLHWGYNHWRAWSGCPVPVRVSPWTDATGASIYCQDRTPLPAGDPHVVYPGSESICSSIRWEVVRKGFEDFEYLCLLQELAKDAPHGKRKEEAMALLEHVRTRIAPDPARHTHDERLLLSTRRRIGEAISALWQEG